MMCIMKSAMHFTVVRVYVPPRILQNCKVWGVPPSICVQLHGERAPNTEFQAESDVPEFKPGELVVKIVVRTGC